MEDQELDDIIRNLDLPEMAQENFHQVQSAPHMLKDVNKIMHPVFNNCQVSINYNFAKQWFVENCVDLLKTFVCILLRNSNISICRITSTGTWNKLICE